MMKWFNDDARFRVPLVALFLALFLIASPFAGDAAAQCNGNCSVSPSGCGTWCDTIYAYQYTAWDYGCQGYCEMWLCAVVVLGIFTGNCDTMCSYDLYSEWCWVYTE